jgi:hypothetical protein
MIMTNTKALNLDATQRRHAHGGLIYDVEVEEDKLLKCVVFKLTPVSFVGKKLDPKTFQIDIDV